MSLWSKLTGQDRGNHPQEDPLFRLSSLQDRLQARQWRFSGQSGVAVKLYEGAAFTAAAAAALEVLERYATEHSLQVTHDDDQYGYRWFLLQGGEVSDHTIGLHTIGKLLGDEGFGDGLLAAALKFARPTDSFYLIYNFKRGRFYPFMPDGTTEGRQTAAEFSLTSETPELPWEKDLAFWYPIWGFPV